MNLFQNKAVAEAKLNKELIAVNDKNMQLENKVELLRAILLKSGGWGVNLKIFSPLLRHISIIFNPLPHNKFQFFA